MKIEILGTGCKKCKELYQRTLEAVKVEGIEAEVIKEEDIVKIMEAGLMSTPGLRVDGKVVSYGKVPKIDEIREYLK
ncbi:MAG TPA: thioredoxin family protein [Fusobacteriaceae bacterium]|nr:thioredoxin family protein [Fusobacteriaceae bacterium]